MNGAVKTGCVGERVCRGGGVGGRGGGGGGGGGGRGVTVLLLITCSAEELQNKTEIQIK